MSGPLGDVTFEVNGKSYALKLGTYALAVLQRKTGVPTLKFINRNADEWGADDMLQIFCAGLHRYKLSEEDVGQIMDDLGPQKLAEVVNDAISQAFGVADKENPPKPAS